MSEMIESNAQNHSDDLRAFPYEVWHPEGEGRPPPIPNLERGAG